MNLSYCDVGIKVGLYSYPGLCGLLVSFVRMDLDGVDKSEMREGKERALVTFRNISYSTEEVMEGMVDHEELLVACVDMAGREGENWKRARMNAFLVMQNLSNIEGPKMKEKLYRTRGLVAAAVEVAGGEGEEDAVNTLVRLVVIMTLQIARMTR